MPDHPSDADLRAYGLGRLDDAPAAEVAAHLDACPGCRRRASEASSDSFLGRLREARAGAVASASSTGGSAPPPPADSLPPGLAEHPDYTILRELGRGGMGVVYLAHNTIMGRDEVLKVMGSHIMERPGIFDRFQREIRAVARLRHPNIVAAYSAFRLGGGLVFAMEYVEGMDLARLVKVKGPLPVVHAAYFAQQAARGLQHAHERGMVHRDIKPHNLMLTHDGDLRVVKILDFGLAKATREGHVDAALTQSGQALGTPDYIAPEQILNAPDVDVRADIYSLGCTLYFFLTGRAPFRGNSLYDLYQAHMSREADPLNRTRPDVPSGLAALASKMIAKDPADRFQTPAEAADALTPFLKKSATAPRPAKGPPRPAAIDPAVELTRDDRPAPPRPPKVTPPAAPGESPPPEGGMWTSLIDFRDTEAAGRSATPPPVLPPARAAARGKVPPRAVAVGLGSLGALLALALLAAQLFVRTPHGTIVFDDLPEDAVVTVDGAKVDVAWAEGAARISVAAGTRGLEVRHGGVKLYGDRITVDADKPFSIRVERPAAAPTATEERPEAEPSKADAIDVAAPADGFTPLFNGRDLSGWRWHQSQPGHWTVLDGALVGSAPGVSHLYSERGDYKDFHLRLRARINDGGNSGVFVRATNAPVMPQGSPRWPGGYEAQINSTHADPNRTGSLYSFGKVVGGIQAAPPKPGEWFDMEIVARGNHLVVKVDGETRLDFIDTQRLASSGHIALQVHDARSRVEFRRIEIKELSAADSPAPGADVAAAPRPAPAVADGFTPLFNGRDLSGWKTHPSQPGDWRVENGVLIGTAPGISHLYSTRGDYKDFELRVQARIYEGGNSGVLFRASDDPRPKWPQGYEAQIYTGQGPQTGGLYRGVGAPEVVLSRPATAPTGLTKPVDCFTMNVVVRGDHVVVKVNGQSAADYIDPQPFAPEGHIALQVHDAATRIEFWSIEIKELAAEPKPAPREGFSRIFNGTDLAGWTVDSGPKDGWSVEGVSLTAKGPGDYRKAGFLLSDRDYGDFRLRFEYQAPPGANSGVTFRARPGEFKGRITHPLQIELFDQDGPVLKNGTFYWSTSLDPAGANPPHRPAASGPPGGWNSAELEVRGDVMTFAINGREVQRARLDALAGRAGANPALKRRQGRIGFQCCAGTVRFRNVEILEAPAAAAWPADAREFRGARYKLFPEKLSWHRAEEECRKLGGRLAIVRDAAQDAFLHGLVREAKAEAAWLGATDERAEGRWVWVDGSPMAYANWTAEQPNNKGAGEHYAVMIDVHQGQSFGGRWADQPDVSVQHAPGFLCEWPAWVSK